MPQTPTSSPAEKPFYKRPWFLLLAALVLIGLVNQALGGGADAPGAQSTPYSPSVSTPAEPAQSTAPADPEPSPAEPEAPTDITSGGIGYGDAVVACDEAARAQLFPGSEYDSDAILGQQKAQIGLSDDQFLAVYNVNVDGRRTAITCIVDGAKDAINVVSIRETEPR